MQLTPGFLLILTLLSSDFCLAAKQLPFVILPSFFRANATNSITITPIKDSDANQIVDIHVDVYKRGDRRKAVFSQKLQAKQTGSPQTIKFPLSSSNDTLTVTIAIERHKTFQADVHVKPDISNIHVHTDKVIYRAGEKVDVRILPLTYANNIYNGPVEISLVNPADFELVRKVVKASDSIASTSFDLPEHLYYGNWKIVARPENDGKGNSYEALFTVGDYELPPFKISVSLQEGDPLHQTRLTIDAKYYHGGTLNGSLVLSCSENTNESTNGTTRPTLIKQSQIKDGYWKGAISLTACSSGNQQISFTIHVEIRDLGTGDRGEVRLDYDPLASAFDLVPLQPFFNSHSKQIPFVTVPLSDVTYGELEVNATCISRSLNFHTFTLSSKIGEYFELSIEKEKFNCNALIVEVKRVLHEDVRSRSKIIVIPYLSLASSFSPSWIQILKPKGFYKVGDKVMIRMNNVRANVPKNFMVLCNSFDVISVGKIRDDDTLKIPVTSSMLGECYIFVYSNKSPYTVDMMLFFVKQKCDAYTTASKTEVKPGHNVTFVFNGEPNGLAMIRAINDRLNSFNKNGEAQTYKSWDLGIVKTTDNNNQQSRLKNFVDIENIRRDVDSSCGAAGALYSELYRTCPPAKKSNSMISNSCLQKMIDKCLNPPTKTTANSCGNALCMSRSESAQIERVRTAGPSLIRARTGNFIAQEEPIFDEPILQPDNDGSPIRQHFHEVWLFEAVRLNQSGVLATNVRAPDDIGRWSIASAYWSPGNPNLCRAKPLEIVSKKDYFLEVDIPRHAYSNESVSVKVSVTALKPQKEKKLSICMTDLSRKICADVGANGRYGESVYSRVIVSPETPIVTKTFTMKFLGDGAMNILFKLREESEYPGKHHCDIGKVYDSVRIKTTVSRRVEAEEVYKVLIVDPHKPLTEHVFPRTMPCKDKRTYNYYSVALDNPVFSKAFEINECRESNGELQTQVLTNILDSDMVQIFTVDIYKFLPNKDNLNNQRRVKRNRMEYRSLFLNEVLMRLSAELYHFKSLRNDIDTKPLLIERSESEIGSLVSEMLRFSDCHGNEKACGFSEYDRPAQDSHRDPLLTSISASLICQAAVDNNMACGPVKYIENLLLQNTRLEDIDVSHLIDLEEPADRRWFLVAMFLQVLNDCASLQCPRNETAWSKLYYDFFDLDETFDFDDRTLAALAFMGTSATSEIMRIKLMGKRKNAYPFWSAGKSNRTISINRLSTFEKLSRARRSKTGDVLVNSLGLLSFIVPGADSEQIDWDSLASWLYEQQQEDGTFNGVLDTFYATRAIHEYRFRKVNDNSELQVKVVCENGPTYEINVANTASEVYFPTNVRNFTLISRGHGKLRVGIHILVSKKQRSRRGLTQDNYYPVRFSIDQVVIANGVLKQTVCFTVPTPAMNELEITHGIYTGYSLKPSYVNIHENSSFVSFIGTPSVSSYAAHFILQGFKPNFPNCYEVGLTEPNYHHEPLYLAPVALQAKHVYEGLIGMALITHPDQLPRFQRSSYQSVTHVTLKDPSQRISRRSIIEESVDTVCFKGGTCTCAETTCSVKCGLCGLDNPEELEQSFMIDETKYVAFGEALRISEVMHRDDVYSVIGLEISSKRGAMKHLISKFVNVWIRKCSYRCLPEGDILKSKFLVVGDVEGISVDSDGEQHYVLRDTDRFELAKGCNDLIAFAVL